MSVPLFGLRMGSELTETVRAASGTNKRSMNSEICHALATHYGQPDHPVEATMQKTKTLTVRLTDEVHARLQSAAKLGPYEISLTTIVERGIELAAQELERMGKAS